jgi:hypothetical protein
MRNGLATTVAESEATDLMLAGFFGLEGRQDVQD